ncbi:MAG: pseudouridine synthase [Gammaproteobacteria bacterium]|nr:pseudouridine synthase [Gammaproteobacteria bacterium]
MSRLVLFNKPFQVMCQFTDDQGRKTLGDYIDIPKVYVAGRLDFDSEGLLALTDDGKLQHKIANPKNKMAKTYWVQVEGVPDEKSLQSLARGVRLKDGLTRPATVSLMTEPENLWPRDPPIRERKHIPTQWLELTIKEGKNRQVRRMTAAIGHPTLRLIRYSIGGWTLDGLKPGKYQISDV